VHPVKVPRGLLRLGHAGGRRGNAGFEQRAAHIGDVDDSDQAFVADDWQVPEMTARHDLGRGDVPSRKTEGYSAVDSAWRWPTRNCPMTGSYPGCGISRKGREPAATRPTAPSRPCAPYLSCIRASGQPRSPRVTRTA
jgi:hypothetical protein